MKSTDLMIGDWVHCITDNVNHRIDSFGTDDRIEVFGEPWYISDGKFNILNDIEPIPLTPEILEKNGFNHWDNDYNDFLGDYYTFLSNKNGGYNICIDSKRTISGHIDYVHELQHALKLCGIEKEIVL